MYFFIHSMLIAQFILFGNIVDSYDFLNDGNIQQQLRMDKNKEAKIRLETFTRNETKQEWAVWISNKKNQSKLIQRIKNQIIEGGLDSSAELSSMLLNLERALILWNKTVNSKNIKGRDLSSDQCFDFFVDNQRMSGNDQDDEEDTEKRIQDLREEEYSHKEKAFDLVARAGEEVMSAGAFAVGGMSVPAIIMGGKASYDFVEACKEFNKGLNCEEEANALSDEDTEEKSWWQFWK